MRNNNNICSLCHGENPQHAIDKGTVSVRGKQYSVWICTNCLIEKNPHRCKKDLTKSIIYINKITKGDKAKMWNLIKNKNIII